MPPTKKPTTFKFDIIGGPTKYDLSTALFTGPSGQRYTVSFGVILEGETNPIPLTATVNSVARNDTHGDEWKISGFGLLGVTEVDITNIEFSTKVFKGFGQCVG